LSELRFHYYYLLIIFSCDPFLIHLGDAKSSASRTPNRAQDYSRETEKVQDTRTRANSGDTTEKNPLENGIPDSPPRRSPRKKSLTEMERGDRSMEKVFEKVDEQAKKRKIDSTSRMVERTLLQTKDSQDNSDGGGNHESSRKKKRKLDSPLHSPMPSPLRRSPRKLVSTPIESDLKEGNNNGDERFRLSSSRDSDDNETNESEMDQESGASKDSREENENSNLEEDDIASESEEVKKHASMRKSNSDLANDLTNDFDDHFGNDNAHVEDISAPNEPLPSGNLLNLSSQAITREKSQVFQTQDCAELLHGFQMTKLKPAIKMVEILSSDEEEKVENNAKFKIPAIEKSRQVCSFYFLFFQDYNLNLDIIFLLLFTIRNRKRRKSAPL
jgi:hypothetical protein